MSLSPEGYFVGNFIRIVRWYDAVCKTILGSKLSRNSEDHGWGPNTLVFFKRKKVWPCKMSFESGKLKQMPLLTSQIVDFDTK